MSHKPGAYLGGIRTVHDLRLRCRIDPDCGCWHWGLATVQGAPKVHFVTPDTGKRVGMRGQRAALYLDRGRNTPDGHVAYSTDECDCRDCVNPAHVRSGTRAEHGAYLRKSGRSAPTPRKLAASIKTSRERARTRLTMEIARQIREAEGSSAERARRFGIPQSHAHAIMTGRAWRESAMPHSSVFAWSGK